MRKRKRTKSDRQEGKSHLKEKLWTEDSAEVRCLLQKAAFPTDLATLIMQYLPPDQIGVLFPDAVLLVLDVGGSLLAKKGWTQLSWRKICRSIEADDVLAFSSSGDCLLAFSFLYGTVVPSTQNEYSSQLPHFFTAAAALPDARLLININDERIGASGRPEPLVDFWVLPDIFPSKCTLLQQEFYPFNSYWKPFPEFQLRARVLKEQEQEQEQKQEQEQAQAPKIRTNTRATVRSKVAVFPGVAGASEKILTAGGLSGTLHGSGSPIRLCNKADWLIKEGGSPSAELWPLPPLPIRLWKAKAMRLGHKWFVLGGMTEKRGKTGALEEFASNSVFRLTPKRTWKKVCSIPKSGRSQGDCVTHAVAIDDRRVFVGFAFDMFILTLSETVEWYRLPPLPPVSVSVSEDKCWDACAVGVTHLSWLLSSQ